MKIGRNEPCHCGSGKKYKKCCLQKDVATNVLAFSGSESYKPNEEEMPEEVWEEEAPEELVSEEPVSEPDDDSGGAEWPPPREYPRPDENLPELPPDQQSVIKDWWKVTAPIYRKRDADAMIQRVEVALKEFPSLFVHLGLHQEYLFELGGELGRRGRMPDYVKLLKRLRSEQRQMFSFCYGAYDSDIIAELVVAGRAGEIPEYFDLFKEFPDAQPDYCHQTCDLLAWAGLSEPLYLLCEAVAVPMATSSEVVGGNFALDWLVRREEIPFYERRDLSPEALQGMVLAIRNLGQRLELPIRPEPNRLQAAVRACAEPPVIHTTKVLGDRAQHHLVLSFISHLAHDRKIPWVQGFLLGGHVLGYFSWCRGEKVPWARLRRKEIEAFAVCRSRSYTSILGVPFLATIQAMAWFARYLGAAGALPAAELDRILEDCRQVFEAGRKVVESTDSAYRICPSFERLVA